jgi:hypothetical protein
MLSLEEQRGFDDVTMPTVFEGKLQQKLHIEQMIPWKLSRTFKLGRETDGPDDHPRKAARKPTKILEQECQEITESPDFFCLGLGDRGATWL